MLLGTWIIAVALVGITAAGPVADDLVGCIERKEQSCLVELAVAATAEIPGALERAARVAEIGRRQALAGNRDGALATLARARALVSSIPTAAEQDAARYYVASAYAEAGDFAAAIAVSREITDADIGQLAGTTIVASAMRQRSLRLALDLLSAIPAPWKADTEALLAMAFVDAGQAEPAIEIAARQEREQVEPWGLIRWLGENLPSSEASTLLANLTTDGAKDRARAGMAAAMLARKDLGGATAILSQFRNEVEREDALRAIALAQAEDGDARSALATAGLAHFAATRDEVDRAVVAAYARAGDYAAATALAESAGERKGRLFAEIVRARAQAGEMDAAIAAVARIPNLADRPQSLNDIAEIRLDARDSAGARRALDALVGEGAELRPMFYPEVRRAVAELARAGDAIRALAVGHRLDDGGDRAYTFLRAAQASSDAGIAHQLAIAAAWAIEGMNEPDSVRDVALARLAAFYARVGAAADAARALAAVSPEGQADALVEIAFPDVR